MSPPAGNRDANAWLSLRNFSSVTGHFAAPALFYDTLAPPTVATALTPGMALAAALAALLAVALLAVVYAVYNTPYYCHQSPLYSAFWCV